MSYRIQPELIGAVFSKVINAKTVGNYLLGVTDPNMTFCPTHVIWEVVAISGSITATPTISAGITGTAYTDILPATNNTNINGLNKIARAGLGTINTLTIPPGSTINSRVSVAATGGTLLTVRMTIIGVYF